MKNQMIVGIVVALLGAGMLAYQGFSFTTKEEVLKIGPITATADKERSVSFPPVIGWVVLAAGIGLIIFGARRK
jgi:hypothetical protein